RRRPRVGTAAPLRAAQPRGRGRFDVRPRRGAHRVTGRAPLAGLRVVDMSTVIAGPGCARYLAYFCADVIKVEAPGGDTARTLGFMADDGDSWFSKLVTRGKRTIVLDLKDAGDLETM